MNVKLFKYTFNFFKNSFCPQKLIKHEEHFTDKDF